MDYALVSKPGELRCQVMSPALRELTPQELRQLQNVIDGALKDYRVTVPRSGEAPNA